MSKPITTVADAFEHIQTTANRPLPLRGPFHPDDWTTICEALRASIDAASVLATHANQLQDKHDASHVRHVQAERRTAELEAKLASMAPARATDLPRTIVLSYIPWAPDRPHDLPQDEFYDTGGYWTVFEGASVQDRLEATEAMVLISAMLLGAKHPPLKSMAWMEYLRRHKPTSNTIERLPIRIDPPADDSDVVDAEFPKPAAKVRDADTIECNVNGYARSISTMDWLKRGYEKDDAYALYIRGLSVSHDMNAAKLQAEN